MRILLDNEYFATGDSLDVIAEIGDIDVSRLSFELDDLKALNREQIDEGGRERLTRIGARNLEEATIAAVGTMDELNRLELSQERREGLEARLDVLQSVREEWNALIEANQAATTHEALEQISWPK